MKKTSLLLGFSLCALSLFAQNPIAFFANDSLVNTAAITGSQQTPDIAMDTAGNYIATWFSNASGDFDVIAQRYDKNGAKIGGEFTVNTETNSFQIHPDIAIDSDGDFVIVWHSFDQDGDRYGIYGQRFDKNGLTQGTEFQVNQTTVDDQFFPDVAMDTAGNFVVTWHSGTDIDHDVYARVYDKNGLAQTGEFIVNTNTTGLQWYPTIVLDQVGNFVIVWHDEPFVGANNDDIYAQRFNADGSKIGSEFRVNTYTTNIQAFGDVGMDATGNFIITWWSNLQDGSSPGIYAQRYDKNGNKLGGEFQVHSSTVLEQSYSTIAIEPDGDFMIAWNSEHLSGTNEVMDIFLQFFESNGNKVGGEIQVNVDTIDNQRAPAITTQKDGHFAIVWQSTNQVNPTSDNDIYHQIYTTTINPNFEKLLIHKTEDQVNTYYNNRQSATANAMDASGNYVVVWESLGQDNGTLNIYGQRYDSTCTKVGSEFRVNTTITGTQVKPAVAMNDNGDFVVTWYGNQSGDFDIYARGFDNVGVETIAEFRVNTTLVNDQSFPDITVNGAGTLFVVVWHSDENGLGTDNDVYAQRYNGAGIAQGGEFRVNNTTTNLQDFAKAVLSNSNHLLIIWDSNQSGGNDEIYGKLYDANGAGPVIKSEFQINTYTDGSQALPDVAVDDNEEYIVTWESIGSQDDSERGIFAQRLDSNSDKMGGEFQVNTYTLNNQGFPSVAKAPDGNFLISWYSDYQDGDSTGIFAQYYNSIGNTLGKEFQVNTFTTKSQTGAEVASNKNGNFVLAWNSDEQDGSNTGIFATTFSATGTYIINTTDDVDDGTCNETHCSLREAINAANSDGIPSQINFNISGTVPFTITPTSSLPIITANKTTINASSQPNWNIGDLTLDGTSVGGRGLQANSVDTLTIKGFQIQNFGDALYFSGSSSILIENNILISNSGNGVNFDTSGGTIKNNYIGTDDNSSTGLGNTQDGITGVEGSATIEGNTICSNLNGIDFSTTGNNDIRNNFIGTDEFRTAGLGNAAEGINIGGSSNDTITSNVIAYNDIGIDANSATSMLISENEIYCNTTNGISNSGFTTPTISAFSSNSISGTTVNGDDIIEVYLNNTADCTATPCQGKTLLGVTTADIAAGTWVLNAPFTISINANSVITAIATNTAGNTSAFAPCRSIGNDECVDAIEIPMNEEACGGETIVASLVGASTSGMTSLCTPNFSGNDIWFKATVPFSGNFLLRKRTGTEIQGIIEAYTGTCGALIPIACNELDSLPNVIIVDLPQDSAGNTIYFRVLDNGNDDTGNIELSAHRLKTKPEKWELCNDPITGAEGNLNPGASERVASDLIVQFEEDATMAEIQAIRDTLMDAGAILVDACQCQTRPLELWRATNPIELETTIKKRSRQTSKVDTTDYNYIIKEVPCTGFGYREVFPPYRYIVGQDPTSSVRVGIIDSGVDSSHLLIRQALWEESEDEACNISDAFGYDFLNENPFPADKDGHGTAINGVLVRNFPSNIRLELINAKFAEEDEGTLFDAICGIYYAMEEGVQILNLSWGFESNEYPQILYDALAEAQKRGILVITSAGNYTANNDAINKYPSNFNQDLDNVIVVTSYEEDNDRINPKLANYANYGKNSVDIATYGFLETTNLNNNGNNAALGDYVGTSMAAPLVARAAALIKGTYPCLSYLEIKDCILGSIDNVAALDTLVASGGVLNTVKAMACAAEKNCLRVDIKVALEGAYKVTEDTMRANITLSALEPFGTGNFETIAAGVQGEKGSATIIDWVLVELRDKNDTSNILAQRAALLRRDGKVVDLDGQSILAFPSLPEDIYYISVQQRNHLGVMTDVAISLSK